MLVLESAYVIFSDELLVGIGSCLQRNFVWRKRDKQFDSVYTVPTLKREIKNIIVWRCFMPLVFMISKDSTKTVNAQGYVEEFI